MKIDIYDCFSTKLRTIQHIIIFGNKCYIMLWNLIIQLKPLSFLYRNFTEKAPRIKNFIIFEEDKIRIRQGNTKLETLFIFAVAQAFNYLL